MVGIGGAGCRIADTIYDYDKKSPSIRCTDGIAIDSDAVSLSTLRALPRENLLFSKALDPNHDEKIPVSLPNDEITARLQSLDHGDIDALIICLGLGGTMAGLAPSLVKSIRKTMVEPVFGLLTLPCESEAEEVHTRAADQIDALSEVVEGILLFDNEKWITKVAKVPDLQTANQTEGVQLPFRRRQSIPLPAITSEYDGINHLIGSWISLVLRAGEVSERPGSEVGEVALDAGEIVNTLRGGGMAAIGLARESLSAVSQDLIRKLRPAGHSVDENHEKAARIIALGKRAVLEEMSVSCNLTDAKKALILIAGPSDELNMRGYMAFRHWIDININGFEVRSGDYPIKHSRFVGVAVILSGFPHIARVDSLRAIRDKKNPVPEPARKE
ncbi:MAG TPA: hypothetical protein PLU94_09210 [Methanoregulaceae archaeon]|nr:hypothetical protein [Methanoregulaceae archaeon]HPM61299.1 hypothetical protein [Methanoregulaceae archaeon]